MGPRGLLQGPPLGAMVIQCAAEARSTQSDCECGARGASGKWQLMALNRLPMRQESVRC